MEGTLGREFIERRDTLLLAGYREALADELAAYNELEPHVDRLGPNVRTEFKTLKVLQTRWHAAIGESIGRILTGLPQSGEGEHRADPFHPREYEQLLVGAARLDEALSNAAETRWAETAATNRAQRWVTVVVGLIALAAVLIVAWLGRGLRLYAAAAERDRAELQKAIEARARLVRGITHDLKNPLNAVVGHSELLSQGIKGELSREQRESVKVIQRSAESLLALIDDILDLSRAERGQLSIVSRATHLESVIEDCVEEQAASAAAAGHRLDIDVPFELPPVTTDPRRVRQILSNLLSNAIKYSPAGGLISICAALRSRPGNAEQWLAVDVSDTGSGIPADKASVIFDEFSRLDIHRNKPGAGLGLAIARRVSRLLGGDLTVDNVNGGGAVFTLWLPLQTSGATNSASEMR